ncbi:MAG TPA: hypothetical protein VI431_02160, partial [Candidatus Acidoferrum sp.]
VAEHANAFAAKPWDQPFQPCNGMSEISGHAGWIRVCYLLCFSSAMVASSGSITGISSRIG